VGEAVLGLVVVVEVVESDLLLQAVALDGVDLG
jgi:hypothetical protein